MCVSDKFNVNNRIDNLEKRLVDIELYIQKLKACDDVREKAQDNKVTK